MKSQESCSEALGRPLVEFRWPVIWFQFFFTWKGLKHTVTELANGCWSVVSSKDCLNHEPLSVSLRIFRLLVLTNFFNFLHLEPGFLFYFILVLFSFLFFPTHSLVLHANRWQRLPSATKIRCVCNYNLRTRMFCRKRSLLSHLGWHYNWLFTLWRAKEFSWKCVFVINMHVLACYQTFGNCDLFGEMRNSPKLLATFMRNHTGMAC